jgi:hypothetical protein
MQILVSFLIMLAAGIGPAYADLSKSRGDYAAYSIGDFVEPSAETGSNLADLNESHDIDQNDRAAGPIAGERAAPASHLSVGRSCHTGRNPPLACLGRPSGSSIVRRHELVVTDRGRTRQADPVTTGFQNGFFGVVARVIGAN